MKNSGKIILLTAFAILVNYHKALAGSVTGILENDTTGLKSNIVIFKMIAAPTNTAPANKSLKKAGSVARTSYSHASILAKAPFNQG